MKFNQLSAVLKFALTDKGSLFFSSSDAEFRNKENFFWSPCSGLFIKKKSILLGNKIINCCTKQLYCEYFTLTKASYLVLLLHIGHIMHCFVLVWQELMWILKYFKGCTFQNDKILNWSSFPLEFVVNDKII